MTAAVVGNPKPWSRTYEAEIGATCPAPGLFLLDSEYAAGDTLDSWIECALPQLRATSKRLA